MVSFSPRQGWCALLVGMLDTEVLGFPFCFSMGKNMRGGNGAVQMVLGGAKVGLVEKQWIWDGWTSSGCVRSGEARGGCRSSCRDR